MNLRLLRSAKSRATALVLGCSLLNVSCSTVGVQTLATSFYARKDSNKTTVWSPRLRAAGLIGENAGVEATYSLDSWTGASIDITTAATDAVTEIRQEVTAGGYYQFGDLTMSGGYRYSGENDYWSNGGVVTGSVDLAQKNTTLAFSLMGSRDTVGRSGDPEFERLQTSIGGRASLTQVLNINTVLQASFETMRVTGYQSSPYRFVAIGGDGTCAGSAALCIPESHPGERLRSAGVVRLRRALGETFSIGGEYRLYFDDWGLMSHTLGGELAWLPAEHDTVSFGYRYYTQSDTDFYKPRYLTIDPNTRYVTRDRELSALYSNRLTFGYDHDFMLNEDETLVLEAALRGGVTRFVYQAFVGLDSVNAIEGTFMLALQFE